MDEDTLKLEFTVKVLSGVQYPSACNDPKHYESIKKWEKISLQKMDSKNCLAAMR